jgi:hypothetical protein
MNAAGKCEQYAVIAGPQVSVNIGGFIRLYVALTVRSWFQAKDWKVACSNPGLDSVHIICPTW